MEVMVNDPRAEKGQKTENDPLGVKVNLRSVRHRIVVFSGKEDKDNFFYDAVVLQKIIRRIDCDAARFF